jgi:hypothetical protein
MLSMRSAAALSAPRWRCASFVSVPQATDASWALPTRSPPSVILPGVGKLVGKRERRHDRKPRIPNLAETLAQPRDTLIEILGETHQTRLLALLCRPRGTGVR